MRGQEIYLSSEGAERQICIVQFCEDYSLSISIDQISKAVEHSEESQGWIGEKQKHKQQNKQPKDKCQMAESPRAAYGETCFSLPPAKALDPPSVINGFVCQLGTV